MSNGKTITALRKQVNRFVEFFWIFFLGRQSAGRVVGMNRKTRMGHTPQDTYSQQYATASDEPGPGQVMLNAGGSRSKDAEKEVSLHVPAGGIHAAKPRGQEPGFHR